MNLAVLGGFMLVLPLVAIIVGFLGAAVMDGFNTSLKTGITVLTLIIWMFTGLALVLFQ